MATTSTGSNAGTSTVVGTSKILSAPQLIIKADAICKRLEGQLIAAKDVIHSSKDVARLVPRRAAIEQAAEVELSKLTPPAWMAHNYQQLLAARRTMVADLIKISRVVAANDPQGERALFASGEKAEHQLEVAAALIGFKYCGQVER